ncbi:uncharacterized protein LOC118493916 [Sander lucioperca]|uniref:uncharacterized protein LOC118493916 n=1 Tax=Sander lucioperca TaxID=283035 RepID=UPI001653D369|nr:uncharacterized protein LOC118493916 [Sander lucioperca]
MEWAISKLCFCVTHVTDFRSKKNDVLEAARADIKCLQAMMSAGQSPPSTDITSFRRYCQAMLILRHRLPANAMAEFQVHEWLERKLVGEGAIIQFAGPGAAGRAVTLSKGEESMLDCYFSHARSLSLQNQAPGKSDQGRFFLGTDGAPVTNLGSHLIRQREKYSPQEPREMAAAAPAPFPGRHLPAACASVSDSLQGQPPASSAIPPMQAGSIVRHWDAFRSAFPVTVHAELPSRGVCGGRLQTAQGLLRQVAQGSAPAAGGVHSGTCHG